MLFFFCFKFSAYHLNIRISMFQIYALIKLSKILFPNFHLNFYFSKIFKIMLISGFLHWKMMKCFNKILITVVVLRCAYSNISWFVTYKYILLSNTFVQILCLIFTVSSLMFCLFVCLSVCLFVSPWQSLHYFFTTLDNLLWDLHTRREQCHVYL